MSAKRAASCFKPSLEGLENRITPSHHKNIPVLIPTVAEPNTSVAPIGKVVDLNSLAGSANSVAGTHGTPGLAPQTALFSDAHDAAPQSLTLLGKNLGGSKDLVTTGSEGSLTAVARPTGAGPGCPPGRPA
jgi:hypothetical protein